MCRGGCSSHRHSCSGAVCTPPQATTNPTTTTPGTPPQTGATGFIGSRLASRLAAQGHTVRVLTRDADAARAALQFRGLEFFAPARWAEAVAGSDAVVNLAGTPIGTRCGGLMGLMHERRGGDWESRRGSG